MELIFMGGSLANARRKRQPFVAELSLVQSKKDDPLRLASATSWLWLVRHYVVAGRKLLAVDDRADFQRLLADLLSLRGFGVSVNRQWFGLIVLDLVMPEMERFAFLETRQQDAELLDMPVVVLTAQSDGLDFYSVHRVLSKPVDFDTLLELASGVRRVRQHRHYETLCYARHGHPCDVACRSGRPDVNPSDRLGT